MAGAASGGVRVLLRVEGLCVLTVSLLAYAKFGCGLGRCLSRLGARASRGAWQRL